MIARPSLTPRSATWLGGVLLLAYCAWIGGPYLYSLFVRDAAVTTWLHVATAPISGTLDDTARWPGSMVERDSLLATIVNPRADRMALVQAEADLATATVQRDQSRAIAARLNERRRAYVALYGRELAQRAATNDTTRATIALRVQTERAESARLAQLLAGGSATATAAEAARAGLARTEAEQAAVAGESALLGLRRTGLADGVFPAADGNEVNWLSRYDSLALAREALERDRAVATAAARVAAARTLFERTETMRLTAPPGAMIWNRYVTPGAHVEVGMPVIAWIDPADILVDAPVSDLEISLLRPGMRALVMIEGERRPREGEVVLTRGSATPIDSRELAVTARGRTAGVAQVLVRLTTSSTDPQRIVVGHPAHVTFPGVSVLRLLRARLRW